MSVGTANGRALCEKLDRGQVNAGLGACVSLPSLGTIDSALRELMAADQRYNSQIAEIIRRDPSLTTRLLKLVNAVHYSTSKPAKTIEEAVFFVGVRQICQLAMVTQIIKDFQKLAGAERFPWNEFWRHCIATALVSREITNVFQSPDDEMDYIGGLIHDVGKIVMASAFPNHFEEVYHRHGEEGGDLMQIERDVLGVDHADLGAMYLRKQGLPGSFIEIVQFHHSPQLSPYQTNVTAAVQVADMLVRHHKIGESGNRAEVAAESWLESEGWKILVGKRSEAEQHLLRTSLGESLERVPGILEGMV